MGPGGGRVGVWEMCRFGIFCSIGADPYPGLIRFLTVGPGSKSTKSINNKKVGLSRYPVSDRIFGWPESWISG